MFKILTYDEKLLKYVIKILFLIEASPVMERTFNYRNLREDGGRISLRVTPAKDWSFVPLKKKKSGNSYRVQIWKQLL